MTLVLLANTISPGFKDKSLPKGLNANTWMGASQDEIQANTCTETDTWEDIETRIVMFVLPLSLHVFDINFLTLNKCCCCFFAKKIIVKKNMLFFRSFYEYTSYNSRKWTNCRSTATTVKGTSQRLSLQFPCNNDPRILYFIYTVGSPYLLHKVNKNILFTAMNDNIRCSEFVWCSIWYFYVNKIELSRQSIVFWEFGWVYKL